MFSTREYNILVLFDAVGCIFVYYARGSGFDSRIDLCVDSLFINRLITFINY
jgi:hypothetical protein